MQKHESEDCELRELHCKNEGCSVVLRPAEMHKHLEECEFRSCECEKCGHIFKVSEPHSCVSYMLSELKDANLKFQNNKEHLEKLKSRVKTKSVRHQDITCKGCNKANFKGVRNICIDCPDFNLCWKCKPITDHQHRNFMQLVQPGGHPGVTCDGCGARNIPGIRFKCRVCPDFGIL